jgi:hypothetical protein
MADWSTIYQGIDLLGRTKSKGPEAMSEALRNKARGTGEFWDRMNKFSVGVDLATPRATRKREGYVDRKTGDYVPGSAHESARLLLGERAEADKGLATHRLDEELRTEYEMWGAPPGDFETYRNNRLAYDKELSDYERQRNEDYLRLQAQLNAAAGEGSEYDFTTVYDAALALSLLPFQHKTKDGVPIYHPEYGWAEGELTKKVAQQIAANFDTQIARLTPEQKLEQKQALFSYLDSLLPGWNEEEPGGGAGVETLDSTLAQILKDLAELKKRGGFSGASPETSAIAELEGISNPSYEQRGEQNTAALDFPLEERGVFDALTILQTKIPQYASRGGGGTRNENPEWADIEEYKESLLAPGVLDFAKLQEIIEYINRLAPKYGL